jgi:glutathione synthase/RimK-type ligase-like ATP-grasp enzyme
MARVAILTPDPNDPGYRSTWRDVLAREAACLAQAGIDVIGRAWTAAGDLERFDLVMPLLVWGYHRAGPAWREATAAWEESGVRLRNPPPVLRWNADKTYLARFAQRGAPVVPTDFVERLDVVALEAAAARFGTDRLIAKPQVSASAWQTIRWSPGTSLDGGPTGPAMIQPYLQAIEREGEISLIWLGGAFSHAVEKRPRPGDFRTQPELGARIAPHQPQADELAAAERILAAVDDSLLYARIDLIRGLDGAPVLMELELVEPDLYLEHGTDGGAAFADAIARAAAVH